MDLHIALTGAIPALIAMWYFDRLDGKRPEPRTTLRLVALAGAAVTVPCIAVQILLDLVGPARPSYAYAFYSSFVEAAFVEELAKVTVVYWMVWHRPEFDERLDGIVYATRAGLGFAMVENVLYLMHTGSLGNFAYVFGLRALLAVPGHAIWAGIAGYCAARKRFDNAGPGLLGGLAIAVAMHGVYDAAIFSAALLRVDGYALAAGLLTTIPPLVIAGGAVWLRVLARRALAADDRDELLQLPTPPSVIS